MVSVRHPVVVECLLLGPALFSQGTSVDYAIPSGIGEKVDPAAPPPRGDLFWAKNGPEFVVYWDKELGTPRYISPRTELRLASPGPGGEIDEAGLVAAARAFVTANEEFFGVSGADLLGPSVTRVDKSWLLAFRQGAAGMPVRGANLRILVHPGGTLASVKAFLLRDAPAGPYRLPDEEEIRLRVIGGEEAEVLGLEEQWVFTTDEPSSIQPAWCVRAEFAKSDVLELFFDEKGERFAARPVELGFVCEQTPRANKATGAVAGFSPAPRDIFATAGGSTTEGQHPLPGLVVRSRNEAKSDLTDDNGDFEIFVSNPVGIIQPELTFGQCDGSEIKTIFTVVRPTTIDCAPGDLVLGREQRHDMATPFFFQFNEAQEPVFAFELMLYHNVRDFFLHSTKILTSNELEFRRRFPLTVLATSFDEQALQSGVARYTPDETNPRICLSRRKNRDVWLPATIIQHEYGHHVIFIVTNTEQNDPMVHGLADALTVLRNEAPVIGFIGPDDPGPIGYSYDQTFEEIQAMKPIRPVSRMQWMVGRVFWRLRLLLKETGRDADAEILLYRWLASNAVDQPSDKAFEFSLVMLEELLDADDLPGDHGFPRADGERANGTPHLDKILEAFAEFPGRTKPFIRGDSNASGAVDLSDAVAILVYLFQRPDGWPECFSAADANRSGWVDLSDGIYLLSFLFLGGPAPVAPFPECGTSEEKLWCKQSGCSG